MFQGFNDLEVCVLKLCNLETLKPGPFSHFEPDQPLLTQKPMSRKRRETWGTHLNVDDSGSQH
jgi:hypothetical protein